MGNRVFVSSTVFDLIDIRAEVEAHLVASGLSPVMSDRPLSEFVMDGYSDSIEICLANVRGSDVFLCILSRRAGPALGACGFTDVSATYLEYLEAKTAGLPIYVFARDRLEADYRTWVANGKPEPSAHRFKWVGKRDFGLFDQLHEHQDLISRSGGTNWLHTFKDSLDLKLQLTQCFASISGAALLRRLLDSGQLPVFAVTAAHSQIASRHENIQVGIANWSDVPALYAAFVPPNGNRVSIGHWPAGHKGHQNIEASHGSAFRIEYLIPTGQRIADEYCLLIDRNRCAVQHLARRYLGGEGFQVLGPDDQLR